MSRIGVEPSLIAGAGVGAPVVGVDVTGAVVTVFEGAMDGAGVIGASDGSGVGVEVVGDEVGESVGTAVGCEDGPGVGFADGLGVGFLVGRVDGAEVTGESVGLAVGAEVGAQVSSIPVG